MSVYKTGGGGTAAPAPEVRVKACPKCQHNLKRLYSKKKSKFYWFCQNATDACGAIYSEDSAGNPITRQVGREVIPELECPACGQGMVLVSGAKYGSFISCSKKECGYTIDLIDQDKGPGDAPDFRNLAPVCSEDPSHGPMRRRHGRNGSFWGCRQYPSCRSTRQMIQTGSEDDMQADGEGA